MHNSHKSGAVRTPGFKVAAVFVRNFQASSGGPATGAASSQSLNPRAYENCCHTPKTARDTIFLADSKSL